VSYSVGVRWGPKRLGMLRLAPLGWETWLVSLETRLSLTWGPTPNFVVISQTDLGGCKEGPNISCTGSNSRQLKWGWPLKHTPSSHVYHVEVGRGWSNGVSMRRRNWPLASHLSRSQKVLESEIYVFLLVIYRPITYRFRDKLRYKNGRKRKFFPSLTEILYQYARLCADAR